MLALPAPTGLALPADAAPVGNAVESARPLLRRLAAIVRQIERRLEQERSSQMTDETELPRYVRDAAVTDGELRSEDPR